MSQSETIGSLAAALAKAQGSMKNPKKAAENPFFKSKYADLAEVWDACREALSANGLAVIQAPEKQDGGEILLRSVLVHASGEWIDSFYPINPVKNDPQGIGSAITYARRYSLASLIGSAPEDDDGETAQGRVAAKPAVKKEQDSVKPTQAVQTATPDAHTQKLMKQWTRTKASGCTETDFRNYIAQQFGVDSTKALNEKQASFWEGQILQVEGEILKGLGLNMMAEIQPDQRDRALAIGKSAWAVILDASRHNQGPPEQGELLPPADEIPGETPHYEPGELKSRKRRGA